MLGTHLVCVEPTGAKYAKASEWFVPTVDPQWILDCATANYRPNEVDYPPGCSGGNLVLETETIANAQDTPRLESTPVESVVLKSVRRQKDLDSTPLGTVKPRLPLNEVGTPQIPRVTRLQKKAP